MEIPVIVPDASVILKWVFRSPEEQHQEEALTILNHWCEGKVHLVLPKLWFFEVGNVLALKNPQYAQEIMEILIGYRLPEYEMTVELFRETFKLAGQYRVTFYDAVYHGVAFLNKGIMVTMDKAYYRKAGKAGNVAMLENFRAISTRKIYFAPKNSRTCSPAPARSVI